MANPDFPLCDLASLNCVSHRVPSSPAPVNEIVQSTIHCGHTHTHAHAPLGGQACYGNDEHMSIRRSLPVKIRKRYTDILDFSGFA